MEWSEDGGTLMLLLIGVGICIWSADMQQPTVVDDTKLAITCKISHQASQADPLLAALGTKKGKVGVYDISKREKVTWSKSGSHPSGISCAEWLPDKTLVVTSSQRTKISKPITESRQWDSLFKFQSKKVKGAPLRLVAAPGMSPPTIAVVVNKQYIMILKPWSKNVDHQAKVLEFPEDQGAIIDIAWVGKGHLGGSTLLVGQQYGHMLIVDCTQGTPKMESIKLFANYLSGISVDRKNPDLVVAAGDSSLAVLRAGTESKKDGGLEIMSQWKIEGFTAFAGNMLDRVVWDAGVISCCTLDGELFVYDVPGF